MILAGYDSVHRILVLADGSQGGQGGFKIPLDEVRRLGWRCAHEGLVKALPELADPMLLQVMRQPAPAVPPPVGLGLSARNMRRLGMKGKL